MPRPRAKKSEAEDFVEQNITHAEVYAAARRSFEFLADCVDGQIPEAKVADQIMAARSILEYAVKQPDFFGQLAEAAGMASPEDLALIATVLE
jgi:hypothetical protein